jgi:O-acetyl-ADP-ribose deacetylase
MNSKQVRGKRLRLEAGDITRVAADAIVNAANSALAGGGGVDGAIHRAGGPALMRELDQIRPRIGRVPVGGAVATSAGRLPARFVFHAVGPVYRDGRHNEPEALARCYRTCLEMADERGVRIISFPAISTGVYGYPAREAAEIAVAEVARYCESRDSGLEEIIFVLFGPQAMEAYSGSQAWNSLEAEAEAAPPPV